MSPCRLAILATGCAGLLLFSAPAPAPAEDSLPGHPPQPQNIPLLPQNDSEQHEAHEDDLMQRLRRAIQLREDRINQLLDRADGDLPPTGAVDLPAISDERDARDAAWRRLEQALADMASEQRIRDDVLDTPADDDRDFRVAQLRARNQLAIARSYKALLEDEENPKRSELQRALGLLQDLSGEYLGESGRPQRSYLMFWFASELARLSQPSEERQRYYRTAVDAHRQLVDKHSDSVALVIAANALMDQLQTLLTDEAEL